ncbi:MAG: ATP-binding protein [Selenomonadaceae bacterium]|nr:ATP-binding protein [Selenomonadaceae bacterium]
MLDSKIARRIFGSFLLLSFLGLMMLGFFLMQYFHRETVENARRDLHTHAQVIALALKEGVYDLGRGLEEDIDDIHAETGLRITVLNDAGTVLADSNRDAETMESHRGRPEVQQALAGTAGSATRYSYTLGENMLYVAIPVVENGRVTGVVRTATSLEPVEVAMQHNMTMLAAALFLALVASALLALWLGHRQIAPILTIIRAARDIMGGNLRRRILLRTDDEFDILIYTLNRLTDSLSQKIDEARTENEKLNLILESMDNGVFLFDEAGNITDANRQARRLFALHPEDLRRHSIHVLGNAEISETAQQVLETGAPKTIHTKLQLLAAPHTFRIYFAAFQTGEAGEKRAVMAVFHDISLMEEVRQRQSEFVGNAAHELRTPLTSIRGFAELLAEDDFSDPAVSRHCADVIGKEAARMERLITGLLELAHLGSRDMRKTVEKESVAVSRIVTAAADELTEKAHAKKQHLDICIETDAKVLAKEDLFQQIVQNLLDNAIKYTPEGGHIRLGCTELEGMAEITVQDDGIGIAPEHLPYIFDRFYRVDKARARQSGGNGIGLALVKFLVKLFEGTITVESEVHKGTRFVVKFPKAE